MNFHDVLEAAGNVTRASHRVKNSGDVELYKLGVKFTRKIRRQTNISRAKTIESEYFNLLKDRYLITPSDLEILIVRNMAGYDDSNTTNENNTTTNFEPPASPNKGDDNLKGGEVQIALIENLSNEITVAENTDASHFSFKEGQNISVTEDIQDKIKSISDAFNEKTGNDLVITDGMREPADQSKAMYNKLESGEDLTLLYKNKEAVNQVIEQYNLGKEEGKNSDQILENMTKTIQQQVDEDIFISKHLSDKAFDVRNSTMNEQQKESFMKAVEEKGGTVVVEGDHFHVQF